MSDVQDHVEDTTGGNPEAETRAREMGWRPKEEFNGPAARWVDAEEFIRRGDEILPIVKKQNRQLEDKLARQESELKEANTKLAEISKSMGEFVNHNRTAEERGYKRALRELKERQEVAVAHADVDTFRKTQAEIDELEAAQPKPKAAEPEIRTAPAKQAEPQQVDPYVNQWVSANSWYNENEDARDYALAVEGRLMRADPTGTIRDRLAEVRKTVLKRFPELVANPRRDDPSAVGASSNEGRRNNGANKRSYENLPADAKAACERFIAASKNTKFPLTREEYCLNYDWD